VSAQIDFSRLSGRFVVATTVAFIVAVAALLGRIGSDSQWLVALGHDIVRRGAIPAGVPFTTAATGRWPNPLVLAELIFDGLYAALGLRGLMLAQLAATAAGLGLLARGARAEGAEPIGTSAALLLAGLGSLPSLAIARVQLFSLIMFPALALLLRAESRAPSRRVWLVVPLLALWSNLHGGVLLGLVVALAYLILERGRREPWLALIVGLLSAAAVCATPAGLRTIAYYHGVLTNAAAQRGVGEWGPLSLHSPFDVVLILTAALLLWRAARARPRLWEAAVLLALAALTVTADRDGVWLVMFAVAPAARHLLRMLTPVAAALACVLLVVCVARGPVLSQASPSMVSHAVALAHGTPVLADGSIDEQVAVAGGRIWAGDPIDAFSHRVQETYLDWLAGDRDGRRAIAPDVRVVLVTSHTATQTLMSRMPGFAATGHADGVTMYTRLTRSADA
jgi:energy-converting hydrogenase Eha subunit A